MGLREFRQVFNRLTIPAQAFGLHIYLRGGHGLAGQSYFFICLFVYLFVCFVSDLMLLGHAACVMNELPFSSYFLGCQGGSHGFQVFPAPAITLVCP